MAIYTINANGFNSYYQFVGQNGEDDTVIVNIGTGFSGTITVDSLPGDGEIDSASVNLPPGWSLQVANFVEDDGEDPSFKDGSYEVLNADGLSVGTLSIRGNDIQGAPCFAQGTVIETARGLVPVEDLRVGDLVATRDNGFQPVRWIGERHLGMPALLSQPQLRPIRIAAGALGADAPVSDLVVSPQHRILVRSKIAQRLFGAAEVLVAAKHLLGLKGIEIAEDMAEVRYFHILFDRHEVVFSNGAETESLYTGAEALKALGESVRAEIFALFPELEEQDNSRAGARLLLSGRQGRNLASRHLQNDRLLSA
ncbi:Hint domain-containing protein [Paracoccus luteus]|uniref:Hint domain-containing protein n=1 Tax=Paracoccus luteus TaxID=2508543 RepID=UPI00106FB88A|nr:Hint domain-containing protein [Paracoccus luteus]